MGSLNIFSLLNLMTIDTNKDWIQIKEEVDELRSTLVTDDSHHTLLVDVSDAYVSLSMEDSNKSITLGVNVAEGGVAATIGYDVHGEWYHYVKLTLPGVSHSNHPLLIPILIQIQTLLTKIIYRFVEIVKQLKNAEFNNYASIWVLRTLTDTLTMQGVGKPIVLDDYNTLMKSFDAALV